MKPLKLLNAIKIPILLLTLIIGLDLLERFGVLPSINEVTKIVSSLMEQYGLIIVGALSFLENFIIFNVYFPGSIVILTAMALTTGNPFRGVLTYLTIYLFAFFAYHIDFYLGRFSGNKKKINVNIDEYTGYKEKNLWVEFFITFWHPQLASFTCFRLGEEQLLYKDIRKHIYIISFFWNTFWALAMYFAGQFVNANVNFKGLSYLYIAIWVFIKILQFYFPEKYNKLLRKK